MIGLGIDTGGTCTDAVIYDSDRREVLSTGKTLTTKRRLEDGIANAIRQLDQERLGEVGFVSLSTTLATNACVENRGAKGKLLFIGADRKVLKNVYKEYGFESLDDIYVIDGMPDGGYVDAAPPDWRDLDAILDEFADAEAIGIVQCYPQKNGGAFEHEARRRILARYQVPVICGSDLFSDLNIIRRGAGTFLNIRLIPVIQKFLQAVKNVLTEFHLNVPIYVVRSDGSLMKEAFAMEHPVETLLCGPAASALGGVWMTEDDNALVVDIGGTTTDIAIIRDGMAVTVDDGIRINGWKTFVKGMYIDTFGLGGDSAIRYEGRKLWLESYRIIPIAMVCREYPILAEKMAAYAKQTIFIDRYPYEGYVLLRDVEDSMLHTEWEQKFFEELRKGPVTMEDAAQIGGRYSMSKNLKRFIEDEHVMRFGLTPTDMMHIRGDYDAFDAESARNAVRVLSRFCTVPEDQIPQIIYDAFVKKLTVNIERVLLEHRFAKEKEDMPKEVFDFLWQAYEPDHTDTITLTPKSHMPIIGVGGPSHIFMKDVAGRLSTRAVLPQHAVVANAIGTLAGQIVVRETSDIVYYPFGKTPGFRIFLAEGKTDVEEFDDAAAMLTEYLTASAREKAILRGAQGEVTVSVKVEKKEEVIAYSDFLFGGTVTVTAYGNII